MEQFSFQLIDETINKGEKIVTTPLRAQIKDLDNHPLPNRGLINYNKYQNDIGISMVKNTIVMQATRGCPYNCAYCHKIWPKSHVKRSAEHIFKELKMYYDIGYRRFAFIDDIFNLDRKNSSKFFNMILDNNIKIHIFFPNGMRGDILDEEYIDLMVKAGVVEVPLALETPVLRLQKLIRKNLQVDKLKKNVKYFAEKYPNVILELFTIHGIPTETEEEAMETYNFINDIRWIHFPYVNILRIYPGTELATIAMENGITSDEIEESIPLAFHEIPNTLPFSKAFTRSYQSNVLYNYILNKERLQTVIPYERRIMTEDEMVQKYNSYFPFEINSFDELLDIADMNRSMLNDEDFVDDTWGYVENPNEKIKKLFDFVEPSQDAVRILFLDLSQFFTEENDSKLYDLVETPLGQMYLLTYLYENLKEKVNGKLLKSRIDFNSYNEMFNEISSFNPDVIAIRTLTYHKKFFKEVVSNIRDYGFNKAIIAGGPYATSSFEELLLENDVDIVIRGEGEETMCRLIENFIENNKEIPDKEVLMKIEGIAFCDELKMRGDS